MLTHTHIRRSARRCTALALGSAALAAGLHSTPARATASAAASGAYGWPVKPFNREHPVRGSFGDPRTVFFGPPTPATVLTGDGSFQFHFGVDISIPDGTPVYPVLSGTVSEVTNDWVGVATGGGRSFQYWHIHPAVRVGQQVEMDRTVLGTVLRGAQHVHFSEFLNKQPVNPLQIGHLTPYSDHTKPSVDAISLRQTGTQRELLANFVRGPIEPVAEAYDTPELAVPGEWAGMPVAPALVTWRLQGLGGKVVVPDRIAVDFRSTIPSNGLFWSYYARGTYQNMSVFSTHFSWRQPGCFLFKLTRTPFDTRTVPDGVYDLVVTATDNRGNTGTLSRRLTIHNRAGWIGS